MKGTRSHHAIQCGAPTKGTCLVFPPTGKQATFTGIFISRMAGGQIAEEWEHFDQLGMLQQLGVVPRI